MTSVLLKYAAIKSAVRLFLLTQLTGTPFPSICLIVLTSPSLAASWKRRTRSLLISMEETVEWKQFEVCETLCHSVQSSIYIQTFVLVKIKLFRVEINLSASLIHNIFMEMGHLTIKYRSEEGNSTVIIQLFIIININYHQHKFNNNIKPFNQGKVNKENLQELRKDCAISIRQKCELHKPGKTNIYFDKSLKILFPIQLLFNHSILSRLFHNQKSFFYR